MEGSVSKSRFKPRALEYFRQVEESGKELLITDHGRPVCKIVPYENGDAEALRRLRGSVVQYLDPTGPVEIGWEAK